MPKQIAEQVVVVTGASSGIGRATALAFAEKGAKVVGAARGRAALASLEERIRAGGGECHMVVTDVADPAQVYRLAEEAEVRFGRIDTWINAAAVSVYASVEDTTDAEFARVMEVNFLGQVYGIHAAVPALGRSGGGVLIGVSSVEGERTVPLHAAYSASKRALRSVYDALRMELAAQGSTIAVTTILPASIDTPFFEHSRSKLGALPKPPPPVYDPRIVADAIVRAATAPTREVLVGGSAIGFVQGQRFSPALTDALMSLGRLGIKTQTSQHPDNGTDILDGPDQGPGHVRGSYSGRTLQHSAFTSLVASMPRPGDVLTRLVARRQRRAA